MNKAKVAQLGGKGTPRRKIVKKPAAAATSSDDKKLMSSLSKLHVQPIPAIDQVNMFKTDGNIIQINSPKVSASVQANTFIVQGKAVEKSMAECLPDIIPQLGPDSIQSLKKLAETYQNMVPAAGADDDVPELVENFEEVAAE